MKERLTRYPHFRANSLDAIRAWSGKRLGPHHRTASTPVQIDYRVNLCRWDDVTLAWIGASVPMEVEVDVYRPGHLIQMPDEGAQYFSIGGQTYVANAQTAVIISPSSPGPIRHWTTAASSRMVLQLADRIVRSSLKDVGLLESRSMLLASPPVLDLTDGSGRAMRILLRTLVEELERPGSELAECSYALEHLTRAIIGLLIEPLRAETPAEASGLEAVVEFVRAHIERPMTLDDLARAGGLSRRQLQRAFNRRHEMSPLEYVRRLRLQKARELLLDSRTRATVAFVAQRTGFKHMGRFAREYRARISANGRPRRSRELCRRGQAP